MSDRAVVAHQIEKHFGAVAALRGVDLELERESVLALLGPNGAGKSTLLRIFAGLARPTAGSLEVLGSTGRVTPSVRARVGFVAHATMLYSELSALENLTFAARLYGVSDPAGRARHLLEEEGLNEWSSRPTRTFSRGMAQRLSIARALVHDPELVLLDEPFTGLDGRAADRLTGRLRRLRGEGRALILVTHDLRQTTALADEVAILVRGRIVERASGADLALEALSESYARAVESAR